MHILKIAFLIIGLTGIAACGKDSGSKASGEPAEKVAPASASSESDQALAELTALRDRICACTDRDCAMRAAEAAADAESRLQAKYPNPTAEQRAAFRAIASDVKDCIRKHNP